MTVDMLLNQPRVLTRNLADLTHQRYVADQIFARGSSDQIAGGVAWYQRAESIFMNRDVEEVGVRSEFPRAGWSEEVLSAFVRKYGLEVPISYESIRRNQIDMVNRAQRKLANQMVKAVDTLAMALLVGDPDVLTAAASGDWTTAATDIIADLANAIRQIVDLNEGYEPDTLIIHPNQNHDLLLDADIRAALPRETGSTPFLTGRPVPLLGLEKILVTPNIASGTVLVMQSKIAGTIADETPGAGEGYTSYSPGAGQSPVFMKVYEIPGRDERIIRAARFPAMWLAEPKSVFKITGA